ncbi:MAG: DUF4410 domain-containing protein [Alphaproteobacteria bacterium]
MTIDRLVTRPARVLGLLGLAAILLATAACAKTKVTEQAVQGAPPPSAPVAFYVEDFKSEDNDVKQGKSILPRGGILRQALTRNSDPETLVRSLSTALVHDLASRGYPAYHLAPGAPPPASGWLVGGEFLEIDEGNRMRRALIGFGSGETEMQVNVDVTDMTKDPGKPFVVLGADTGSGKMPGAAITMNPYVAAAKFVMSKNAPERDVKRIASEIGERLAKLAAEQAH